MDAVIGLGTIGCKIASILETFDLYEIYKIDDDKSAVTEDNLFYIERRDKIEDYEQTDFSFLKDINGEILFITCGAERISAASLRLLETVKDHKIHVLYIKPETDFLYGEKMLLEKSVFNILQEYARSGLFERIILIDNTTIISLKSLVGSLPIDGFYDKINELIAYTIHGINVCEHQTPILSQQYPRDAVSRIGTIGMKDVETGAEKMFFPLELPREVWYYYVINNQRLKQDGGLYEKIRAQLKQNLKFKTKYGVYKTEQTTDCCYCLTYSSIVQNQNLPKSKK